MNVVRFVAAFSMTLFAGAAVAQPPVAPPPHLPLDTLAKEYKRYGLPLPPPTAQLVRIDWYRYRDPRPEPPIENPYVLAWRVPPAKPGERPLYLIVHDRGVGFGAAEYVEPAAVEEVKPASDAARSLEYQGGGHFLVLAVQCKDRGWDDLADALYSLARNWPDEDESRRPTLGDLRTVAEMYWYGQVTSRTGDRKEALRQLTALAAEDGPPDRRVEKYLRDLELTLAPRKSRPGSVQALIDDLTEYWDDPFSFVPKPAESAGYRKLVELGFDAVPALIEHVNDDRLTRTWSPGAQFGAAHSITVGHLCSQLLFDLSVQKIGGRFSEAGGDRLDPAEARKWFEKAKQIGEEKWLVEHAIPTGENAIVYYEGRSFFVGKGILNHASYSEPHLVRVIGAKFPARLPAIYRAMLKKSVEGGQFGDFVSEIVVSKLPREQKIMLFEEGAASDDFDHRLFALKGLAQLDQALLRKHLLAALKKIQIRNPKRKPDWDDEDRLLRLVETAEDRACWDALGTVVRAVGVESRMSFLWSITPFGSPEPKDSQRLERIRFLMQFLDDATPSTEWSATKTEVRDFAASRLAGLLGFRVRRQIDSYRPVHDDLGPLTRLLYRELMRQTATRELAVTK